jgi:ABC-type transport system substrate-binding protein
VTAADVKYSLETAASTRFPGLSAIKSVEAVGTDKVKITLTAPEPDFLPYFTIAPIGTGPFAFDSFTPQVQLVLKKNASILDLQTDIAQVDWPTATSSTTATRILTRSSPRRARSPTPCKRLDWTAPIAKSFRASSRAESASG